MPYICSVTKRFTVIKQNKMLYVEPSTCKRFANLLIKFKRDKNRVVFLELE